MKKNFLLIGFIFSFCLVILSANVYAGFVPVKAGRNGGEEVDYDLYVSEYEVTNAQFVEFLNDISVPENGRVNGNRYIYPEDNQFGGENLIKYDGNSYYVKRSDKNYPVNYVTWFGAAAYCNWLSELEGLRPAYDCTSFSNYGDPNDFLYDEPENLEGYRLPTMEEHQYIMRGGKYGKSTRYAGSSKINKVGWCEENTDKRMPVGKKAPNELGIYDLSGNVAEWTNTNRGGNSILTSGGSFAEDESESCCGSYSSSMDRYRADVDVGFRVVRTN